MTRQTPKPKDDAEAPVAIATARLVTRLSNCANGKAYLTPMQVRAIEILLRKTLPDLRPAEKGTDKPMRHEDILARLK
jgi:hypothetical protein